jgi:hypothetical protein
MIMLLGCRSGSSGEKLPLDGPDTPAVQTPLADDAQTGSVSDLAQRCARSVEHIALGIYPEDGQPLGSELALIQAMVETVTKTCIQDGLTTVQAQCLMAAQLDDHLQGVRTCLGPRATWPKWFTGAGISVPK